MYMYHADLLHKSWHRIVVYREKKRKMLKKLLPPDYNQEMIIKNNLIGNFEIDI